MRNTMRAVKGDTRSQDFEECPVALKNLLREGLGLMVYYKTRVLTTCEPSFDAIKSLNLNPKP